MHMKPLVTEDFTSNKDVHYFWKVVWKYKIRAWKKNLDLIYISRVSHELISSLYAHTHLCQDCEIRTTSISIL